jgi:hypothetical protein
LHDENKEILSTALFNLPPNPKNAVDVYLTNVSSHFDSAIALRNDLVRDGFMDTNSATQWQEVLRHAAFYLKPRAELGGAYTEGRPLCAYEAQRDCLNTPVYAKLHAESKWKGRYFMGWITKVRHRHPGESAGTEVTQCVLAARVQPLPWPVYVFNNRAAVIC